MRKQIKFMLPDKRLSLIILHLKWFNDWDLNRKHQIMCLYWPFTMLSILSTLMSSIRYYLIYFFYLIYLRLLIISFISFWITFMYWGKNDTFESSVNQKLLMNSFEYLCTSKNEFQIIYWSDRNKMNQRNSMKIIDMWTTWFCETYCYDTSYDVASIGWIRKCRDCEESEACNEWSWYILWMLYT